MIARSTLPIAVLLCAVAAPRPGASGEAEASGAARLAVDDPVFDWGTLWQGQTAEHTFRLQNRGADPVTIAEVRPNCGCTVARGDLEDRRVAPGETVELTLAVDAGKLKEGAISKSADVIVKGAPVPLRLYLRGEVLELFDRSPHSVTLEAVRDGGLHAEPVELMLRSKWKAPLEVVSVAATESRLRAATSVVETGRAWRVRLELHPALTGASGKLALSDVLRVETRELRVETGKPRVGAREPEPVAAGVGPDGRAVEIPVTTSVEIPVTIRIRERVQVLPSRSVFFARRETRSLGEAGKTLPSKALRVRSIGRPEHRFRIVKVEVARGQVDARVETVEAGRHYRLVIELRPLPSDFDGRIVRDTVTIHTDDPEIPTLRIPAVAQI